MGKKRKSGQEPAREGSTKPKTKKLTWREERFIWAYIDNGGNGAMAAREAGYSPISARQIAADNMAKPYIRDAIDSERERLKNLVNFTREKAVKILVGQATARAADFTEVLRDPRDKKNYKGLFEKEFAIEAVEHSSKNGNKVKLISNSERRAIIDDLWEKLGLDKEAGEDDRLSFLERFAGLGKRLGRGDKSGEPSSEEGSE